MTQTYIPIFLLSPLERRCDPSFQHIWVPFTQDTLCQVWLKLAKLFLRKIFLKVVNVFSLCGYYLPLKKCMVLNLNKFEFPRILCVMFGWNWPSGSGEDFQKLSIFFHFLLLSPLRKRAMSTQGWSVPSLVEIGPGSKE